MFIIKLSLFDWFFTDSQNAVFNSNGVNGSVAEVAVNKICHLDQLFLSFFWPGALIEEKVILVTI